MPSEVGDEEGLKLGLRVIVRAQLIGKFLQKQLGIGPQTL